ncbi:MAG: extracellular solute-binding protein [Chloroflexi bacterium]|nr:extracellular solute-binding protein [Chloroflexota bacterium]
MTENDRRQQSGDGESPDSERGLTRRGFLITAATAAAGLAVGACGQTQPPAPAKGSEPAKPSADKPAGGAESKPAAPNVSTGGGELHLLQWQSFVPEMDALFEKQLQEWGAENKVKVRLERINANDLQARTAAAIQAKAGPDSIQMQYNWPWLYTDSLVDVSKEAEEVGKQLGGYYGDQEAYCKVKDVWRAIPYAYVGNAFAYRTDFFKSAGVDKAPTTWDEFMAAGKKLKTFGKPIGQALGHSFGDPPTFWYPVLWSFGGKEVEKNGKTVAIESAETLKAVEWAVELYNTVLAPGALSWDDSSNNRSYLAEQISCTLNGARVYFSARKDFAKIADATDHFLMPSGPAGQHTFVLSLNHAIMSYSKNQQAAKDLIRWFTQPERYSKWLESGKAYDIGALKQYENEAVFTSDRKLLPFRDSVKNGKWPGWPGPSGQAAAEVQAKYIVVDLFAKACSGEFKPADSIKWAAGQLKGIYGKA